MIGEYYNMIEFDLDTALSYSGGVMEIFKEIAKFYIITHEENAAKIEKAFNEENWNEYEMFVHSLKSTSLQVGAKALSEFAKNMEFAAKDVCAGQLDKIKYIKDNNLKLLEDYEKVCGILKEYI